MSDSTNPCCPPNCLPQPVTSPLDCVLMWVAVCRGATGVPGMNGIAGSNGFDGETGPQGPTGIQDIESGPGFTNHSPRPSSADAAHNLFTGIQYVSS